MCKTCGAWFQNKPRPLRKQQKLWNDYARGRDTLAGLSKDYGNDPQTIRALLDAYTPPAKDHQPRQVVFIIDATYFGRGYGVLVARDPHRKENLHVIEIASETKWAYQSMKAQYLNLDFAALLLSEFQHKIILKRVYAYYLARQKFHLLILNNSQAASPLQAALSLKFLLLFAI